MAWSRFQKISLAVLFLSVLLLLPESQASDVPGCGGVQDIYGQNGCCGKPDSQLLSGAVSFPLGDVEVGPTCGDLKGLFQDQSCCLEPQPVLELIWCDATNCTDVGSHTIQWTAGFQDPSARAANLSAGTKLKFVWNGGHNVYLLPNAEAFQSCDFTSATNLGAESPVMFTIPLAQQSNMYFACQVSSHCHSGQKMELTVTNGVPTRAPTSAPISEPISEPTSEPTAIATQVAAPTDSPTFGEVSASNCSHTTTVYHFVTAHELQHQPAGFPFDIVPAASAVLQLPESVSDELLTLLWVQADECSTTLPVARSYHGYPWEGVMPKPLFPHCDILTGSCVVNLANSGVPSQISNAIGAFVIQTTKRLGKNVTQAEAAARLMIQGTFGVTKAEIDATLENFGAGASNGDEISDDKDASTAAAWFEAEVQKPPTYLRQRYRLNTNPRMFPNGDYSSGEEYGRCDIGSRWHRYTFNYWDKGKHIDMKASNDTENGVFQIFVDGVLRTEIPTFLTYTWSAGHADTQFYICDIHESSDQTNDRAMYVYPTAVDGANCGAYVNFRDGHKGVNPLINFRETQSESTQIYSAGQLELGKVKTKTQGVYYVKDRSSEATCQEPGVQSGMSFMGITNTSSGAITYYKLESRMKFVENTVVSPSQVESFAAGGKPGDDMRGGDYGVCPVTPKTFINDGTCVQRTKNICTPLFFKAGTIIKLDAQMLRKFYLVSQKYVYVIKGLRVLDSHSDKFPRSPCRPGYIDSHRSPEGRARFIRTNGSCPDDSRRLPEDGTEAVILAALRSEPGDEIRDIMAWEFTAANGGVCSTSEDAIGASIDLDGHCWTQSHPHEQNVYDCTRWVMAHGGNIDARNGGRQNPIAKWAMNGHHELHFPDFHPQGRWDWSNLFWDQSKFRFMGKWGDEVDFSTLPTRVQTKEMAEELGVSAILDHQVTFESCGSRGEVQNDPSRGHSYLFEHYTVGQEQGLDRSYHYWENGPSNLWQNVVLRAPDQLRHRVAWALNNFIVAMPVNHWQSEPAAVFYDIFVNHAFGNFRAIIREIAQNQVMAKYLTFEGNRKHANGVYPDENFSRESMQLFTIGLYELNMDGTKKLNPDTGEPIPTYDNSDVVSFARIWTGWNAQKARSNAQGSIHIDPLKLASQNRDTFAKTSLDGGYLGDGYPLCNEQPPRAFLLKGARYHKTGAHSALKLTYAEDEEGFPIGEFADEASGFGGRIREHFAPDPSSQLYDAICSADGMGNCTFPVDVYLPATLSCSGNVECGADILHVVKMVQGNRYDFYKYIEPLCVDLQFFQDGKTMVYGSNPYSVDQCADPNVPTRAGVACCKPVLKAPLEYPSVDGVTVTLIVNGVVSLHRDNLYKFNIVGTGDYRSGTNAPMAFSFPGRDDRLYVKQIIRWAYGTNLFIFEPGYGITLEDLQAFFTDTNGMSMSVEWWDPIDDVVPFNAGGDQCLYLAEPMTFATAEQRCNALNGSTVCPVYKQTSAEDGTSPDWLQTCSGFQYDWTDSDCGWRVNIHRDGPISIADYTDATGDWFGVQWSTPDFSSTSKQAFPHPDENNCGEDATPSYLQVAEKRRCQTETHSDTVIGRVDTLQNCAAACSVNGDWDWFTYGRNDSLPWSYCDATGCKCTCTKQSSSKKDRCIVTESDSTDLYKFERRCKYLPGEGGSCLCDIDVDTTAVYTDATTQPPSVAELRLALNMAASPPADFGDGVYTQCTTLVCTSQTDVVVHIKGASASPSEFDEHTIFEITSAPTGKPGPTRAKYLLNRKSVVYVGPTRQGDGALFSFRNAPTFNPSQGVRQEANSPFNSGDFTEARAQYETTALIDHLVEHPNTAPFVAYRLIQRLTTSNPSPRYVEAVATAFATGVFDGKTYSGMHGDMEATVAAILLDREARASILDSDPKHGQLREPLLKLFHMLRAMDFKTENDLELGLTELYAKLGQEPLRPPSVFSFFTPHYSPEGPVLDAGLVSPEAMLTSSPWTVSYLSGMAALASNGVSNADTGFGDHLAGTQGHMHFKPSNPVNVAAAVDELSILLTAGRISSNNRAIISAAYDNGLSTGTGWYDMSNATATMGPVVSAGIFGAASAIDDNDSNAYWSGCASATGSSEDLPWWQVDLKRTVNVTHVAIVPRGAAASQMIHGVDIEVDGVVCASNLVDGWSNIPCNLVGQTVKIVKRNGDLTDLQLCDFKVGYNRFAIAPGVYEAGELKAEAAALREALTLFSILPEYHTTVVHMDQKHIPRAELPPQVSHNRPYKSVIATHLIGGADSFNILVPLDGCTKPTEGGSDGQRESFDLYGEYASVRGSTLALPTSKLNAINVPSENNQPCARFGITNKLPILHTLYNDGDAMFVANMGAMVEPLNKHNKKEKKQPAGNYGHNQMVTHCLAVDAGNLEAKGVIGRMVNNMMQDRNGTKGYKSQMYSLQGATKILEGAPGTPVHLSAKSGVVRFSKFAQYADDIANMSKYKTQSVFGEHYLQKLHDHLKATEELGSKMDGELQTSFSDSGSLGQQFEQVAKAIRMDTNLLEMERSGFFTSHFGYDTHGAMNQDALLAQLNSAITSLVADLKVQGLWDNVVIVVVSDFGRTLTGNSQGTDHGWGGNYFILGGKVNGGQVLGTYPDRLDPIFSDENDGRGRMIPTTPWESVWNGVAEWYGVDKEGRDRMLPIMKNFETNAMFSADQLFQT